ncbi:methyltransferase family protein [Vannielia litorea]|uniref:methyltransferase family protein n=1 Tax=Vannielia litorea TaxID=1217970 RepID=UPI001BCDD584|nr:isoprenylcysteine carboxylmethyltransferase family protein [Vannielia litorea]MBS8226060.1 isoprenylcysteine carboxylmethyltransferase family protein [Vannielia litorea]
MIDFGPSYGLWLFAFINSAVFILFAFSFFKPQTSRDWRSFGAFSAFIVALFAEMYGFPLTIFFLSGWLQSNWPGVDWFAHDSGHLPEMILGWRSNPHFGVFHLFSFALIGGGFWLISVAWHHLWTAQRQGRLALTGPYTRIRHPQYAGFVLIMAGFLLQWPTLLTLAMFPVLVWMYARLARSEEADSRTRFGKTWESYSARVPAFIPRLKPADTIPGNGSHGGAGGS